MGRSLPRQGDLPTDRQVYLPLPPLQHNSPPPGLVSAHVFGYCAGWQIILTDTCTVCRINSCHARTKENRARTMLDCDGHWRRQTGRINGRMHAVGPWRCDGLSMSETYRWPDRETADVAVPAANCQSVAGQAQKKTRRSTYVPRREWFDYLLVTCWYTCVASVASTGSVSSPVYIVALNETSPARAPLTTTRQVALALGSSVDSGEKLMVLPMMDPAVCRRRRHTAASRRARM